MSTKVSDHILERLREYGVVEGAPAGMYVTLQLSSDRARRASEAAAARGFDVPLLTEYSRAADRHGLVLGFGGCTDDQLARVLAILDTALAANN